MERAYRRPETLEGSGGPGRSSHATESPSEEAAQPPSAAGGPLNAARGTLREVFGFEGFRPGQEAVIEALLDGRNALIHFASACPDAALFRMLAGRLAALGP